MNNRNYRVALNVAEKHSVCKSVTEILSNRNSRKLDSESQYNPVFDFECLINSDTYRMIFTSVRGHMMNYQFGMEHKHWVIDRIGDLYTADIDKVIVQDCKQIEINLKKFGRQVDTLILWLDCDREGENIAFEVIDVVRSVNPGIRILRAHFSALTDRDIKRAVNTLQQPNKHLSDAVDIRQKIDLIIGASFTRLQTLTFRNLFYGQNNQNNSSKSEQKHVISYGPCQFPTLNFIVERTEKIRNFKPEEFYYIDMVIKRRVQEMNQDCEIQFSWKRNRLFDELIALSLYERVLDAKNAKVVSTKKNPKTRLRPVPLNTVEMQKLISKKLKINSHKAMEVAEKLYQKGFISYPRTETQKFGKNEIIQLKKLVQEQTASNEWGRYAENLLDEQAGRYNIPRFGKLDDNAHPPIHPVKFADPSQLEYDEKRIYALLVKHFLACVSPDAKGLETIVEVEMGEEYFTAKGLIIQDRGYLEIYTFDNWSDTLMPDFNDNEDLIPSKLLLQTGKTSPPNFLTEAELIALMDKQGIGTDATIHEHIKHIQDRGYANQTGSIFKPTLIGTALIKTYEALGLEIYKPYLRAAMEKDMKEVCEGKKSKDPVFGDMKKDMKAIFDKVYASINRMKDFLIKFLDENKNYEDQLKKSSANINSSNLFDRRNFNQENQNNNQEDGGDDNADGGNRGADFGNGGRRGGRGGKRGGRGGGRGGKKGGAVAKERKKKKDSSIDYDELDSDNENINNKSNTNNNNSIAGVSNINQNNSWNNSRNFNNFNSNNNNFQEQRNIFNSNTNNNLSKPNNFSNSNSNSDNKYNNYNSHNSNSSSIANCPKCDNPMKIALNKQNKTYFLGCSTYPNCRSAHSINNPIDYNLSNKVCNKCSSRNNNCYLHQLIYSQADSKFMCLGECYFRGNIVQNNNFRLQSNSDNIRQQQWSNNNFQQQQFKQAHYNKNGNKKHQKEEEEEELNLDNFDTTDFFI